MKTKNINWHKIFLILATALMVFSTIWLASVASAALDITQEVKSYEGDKYGYGEINLKDLFGFGTEFWKGQIVEHTPNCGYSCSSIMNITLTKKGTLFDSIKFYTLAGKSRIEQPIRNYQTYLKSNDVWVVYNKEILPEGTYTLKLEGIKNPEKSVDWVLIVRGESLDEWANWINIVGDDFDDGVLNTTLWLNETEYSGSYRPEIIETDGFMRIRAYGTDDGSTTFAVANLSFKQNLYGLNPITNITFVWNTTTINTGGGTGCEATDNIYIDDSGTARTLYLQGIVDTGTVSILKSTWSIIINQSNNKTTIYNSTGANVSSVLTTSNNLKLRFKSRASCAAGGSTGYSLSANIHLFNISFDYGNEIFLNSPINNFFTNATQIVFNATATPIGGTLINMSLFINSTGIWQINQTNSVTGASNNTVFNLGLSTGTYIWGVEACATDGSCGMSENRTIIVDVSPPLVNITYPLGSIPFLTYGQNITFNYTASDAHLASCWFNYNSVNTMLNCGINSSFIYAGGANSITLYANDSAGNFASYTLMFTSPVQINNQTYTLTTYETTLENFILNLTYNPSLYSAITANLIYNGTTYAGTKVGTGNNVLFTKSLSMANPIANKSFYWNIRLNNGTGFEYYNSTFKNQTVNLIVLAACNATYNKTYFNFTMLEEGTFNLLNSSIEVIWNYGLSNTSQPKILLFSNITDNRSNYGFCFSPSDKPVSITGITNYYKAGYDSRTNYFVNTSKTNATTNTNLYLLSTATSDVMTFTVIDDFLNPVEGAQIQILRWDLISDTFYVVNTIYTDGNGHAGSNIRLNDAFYIYMVSYQGTLYLTTTAAKETSITRTLQIFLQPTIEIYEIFNDISHSLTYNNLTNVFVFTYNDASNTISGGCLKIYQITITSNNLIDSSCSTSPSSVLTSDITAYGNGTFSAQGSAFKTSGSSTVYYALDSLTITKGTAEKFAIIGKAAQAISLVFIGTMAMIGVAAGSIPLGLILIIASFIVVSLIGFVNLSQSFITTMIAIILLIVFSLSRRFG